MQMLADAISLEGTNNEERAIARVKKKMGKGAVISPERYNYKEIWKMAEKKE